MSTTTVTHSTVQDVLSDYTIRLTGDNPASQTPRTTTDYSNTNPPDWPSDRRRVPDYQPIDRNRGPEERPNGDNAGERIFLSLMFTGVVLNASVAKAWGATGGRYFPNLFKYAIGGEW
ncbi:hypothetical protein B0J14DRAFT_526444 [Halenospora varia]|nr:hypothetical protein B0J14DRAFT_526444 [Halenospora varia]